MVRAPYRALTASCFVTGVALAGCLGRLSSSATGAVTPATAVPAATAPAPQTQALAPPAQSRAASSAQSVAAGAPTPAAAAPASAAPAAQTQSRGQPQVQTVAPAAVASLFDAFAACARRGASCKLVCVSRRASSSCTLTMLHAARRSSEGEIHVR